MENLRQPCKSYPVHPRRFRVLPAFLVAAVFSLAALGSLASAVSASEHHFTTSDGARLHYTEAGKGAHTLVFVPGWLMPAAIFEKQIEALSREFRVIAFDPRAHGKSQVHPGPYTPERRSRDLHELLHETKTDSCILAGWSLGVMEVLDYIAKHHPKNVRGLILIDNSIGEGTPPRSSGSSTPSSAGREERMRAFTQSLTKTPLPKKLFQTVYQSTLQIPPPVASELIRKPFPREYWRDTLLAQKIPVLYAIRPRFAEQGEALRSKRPALASVEVFPQAGHALFWDDAERFNRLTSEFARRVFTPAP
jgi:non-heme chloroperoxidase